MNKIPVHLVTGFLGSGKTSLITHLINQMSPQVKIGVVQNEFAPINIDGINLKANTNKPFELLEINNGSVFCVCQLSHFITAIHQLAITHCPDTIIIEASGMSDPSSIGELFNQSPLSDTLYLAGSICIVDALNFLKTHPLVQRIKSQLLTADVIVLNKTDLTNDLPRVRDEIIAINPFANLTEAQHGQVSLSILEIPLKKERFIPFKMAGITTPQAPPEISSAVLKTTRVIKESMLNTMMEQLCYVSMRLKGFVSVDSGKTFLIQGVMDTFSIQPIDVHGIKTELIIIGQDVSMKTLKNTYLKFAV